VKKKSGVSDAKACIDARPVFGEGWLFKCDLSQAAASAMIVK
jgi:hypothetical protein